MKKITFLFVLFGLSLISTAQNSPPSIIAVTSSTPNGTYEIGDVISIQITFSAPITVTGEPLLALEIAPNDRSARFTGVTNTTIMNFEYRILTGETSPDLSYVSTNALILRPGVTIKSAQTNNNAAIILPVPGQANSLSANHDIVIDATTSSVIAVTSPNPNTSYKSGDIITIQVIFTGAITVTGEPLLNLEIAPNDRAARFTGVTFDRIANFEYRVLDGETSPDLSYVSTNALILRPGVTIKNAQTNNDANISLPVPGQVNSLSANHSIVIDNTGPSATISSPESSPTSNSQIVIYVDFNESARNFTADDLIISNATIVSPPIIVGNGLRRSLTIQPNADGAITLSIPANTFTDVVGNSNTASNTFEIIYEDPAFLSVAEFSTTKPLFSYNNPVTHFLNLNSSAVTIQQVNIYHLSGKLLGTYSNTQKIDLSFLTPNFYIVEIITNNTKTTLIKILKQ